MKRLFADSYYYFAILNSKDSAHERALPFSQTPGIQFITTAWVLTEVADGLSSPVDRLLCGAFIKRLQLSPRVIIIPATQQWFDLGLDFYIQRPDKNWSLTDCISFLVMRQHGLTEALTGDHHFDQAGFKALLTSRHEPKR